MRFASAYVPLRLEPAHGGTEGIKRARHLSWAVRDRHEATRRTHDVYPVGKHGDAQPVSEIGVARTLEALEAERKGIEGRRIDLESVRILKNQERRSLAVDSPGDLLLKEYFAQAIADLCRGSFCPCANVLALDKRQRRDS